MVNILLVDDDENTRKLMRAVLKMDGYNVFMGVNGQEALDVMESQHIDLVILDIMMPVMDGYKFANILRQSGSELPILMITAKHDQSDKKKGFLVGTDDYMTKPVDETEMLLRVKALLRRSKIVSQRKIEIGDVVVDYDSFTVSKNQVSQTLPPKEFFLLYKLLSYPNKIFTRYQLLDEIWGMETDAMDNTVIVHINRLRKRFENFSEFEIITVRGLGYKGVRNEE